MIVEGQEKEEFWQLLGGKQEYASDFSLKQPVRFVTRYQFAHKRFMQHTSVTFYNLFSVQCKIVSNMIYNLIKWILKMNNITQF